MAKQGFFLVNVPAKLNFLNCFGAVGIAYLGGVRTCFASDLSPDWTLIQTEI